MTWLASDRLLTFEEIGRLSRIAVALGIRELRLTGGEPTLRPGLPDLVRDLAQIEGTSSLSLTTNGFLLKRLAGPLAEAGPDPDQRQPGHASSTTSSTRSPAARRWTRCWTGWPSWRSTRASGRSRSTRSAMRDFTEDEIVDFAKWARKTGTSSA